MYSTWCFWYHRDSRDVESGRRWFPRFTRLLETPVGWKWNGINQLMTFGDQLHIITDGSRYNSSRTSMWQIPWSTKTDCPEMLMNLSSIKFAVSRFSSVFRSRFLREPSATHKFEDSAPFTMIKKLVPVFFAWPKSLWPHWACKSFPVTKTAKWYGEGEKLFLQRT